MPYFAFSSLLLILVLIFPDACADDSIFTDLLPRNPFHFLPQVLTQRNHAFAVGLLLSWLANYSFHTQVSENRNRYSKICSIQIEYLNSI